MHTQTSLSTQEGAGKCSLQTILLNFRKLYDPCFWLPQRLTISFLSLHHSYSLGAALQSFLHAHRFLGLESAKEASKALTVTSHLNRKEEVQAWSDHC